MNKLYQNLIEGIIPERMANTEERNDISNRLSDILVGREIVFSDDKKNNEAQKNTMKKNISNIEKYLIPIPHRLAREYIPDLEDAREHMEQCSIQNDISWVSKTIDYIFLHYKKALSFSDTIDLYLYLVFIVAEKNIDDALLLFEHIAPYEAQFSFEQKDFFLDCLSVLYFEKAEITNTTIYYQEASDTINKLLTMDRTNEYSDHLGDHLLDIWRYKKLLYMKILSDFYVGYTDTCIENCNDFLNICWWNPKTKTYKNKEDKTMLLKILFIQWESFESVNNYDQAILCYQDYLCLAPEDLFVQGAIQFLQSKKSS